MDTPSYNLTPQPPTTPTPTIPPARMNVMPPSQAMTPPTAPRRSHRGLILGIVIIVVLGLGGYAGAAFWFKLWPFSSFGSVSKERAFAELFTKAQAINSASYQAQLGVKAEAREVGATAFEALTFPEFVEEQEAYKRDQNRVRNVQAIALAVNNYREFNAAFPTSLADLPSLTIGSISEYGYTPMPATDDYTLTVTFETEDAVKSVAVQSTKIKTKVDGKTVTITKANGSNFYFYGAPRKPSWVTVLEERGDSFLAYAPGDFELAIHAGGTSQKNQDKAADASFQLGGDVTFGDLSVAADVEVRKKGDVYYGQITKFPSLFFDLSPIKNKWVKVTPEDLISTGSLPYIATFVGDKQKKNSRALEQIQTIFKTMDEDKVLSVDFSLPNEMVGEREAYVYAVTYDETKVVSWYEHLTKVMKETYGDDALIKLDETSLRYMKTDSFQKYLAYIKNNTTMHIVIDKQSGFPVRIDYRFRLVPSEKIVKLKDKQLTLNLALNLSNVNVPVVVDVPPDAITFEGAQITLTGQSKEEYRFGKQIQNVEAIRSALSGYYVYTGTYPETLEGLSVPRGQLEKAPPKPATSGGGASIDFPTSFDSFSSGTSSADYQKKIDEMPFLKTLPKDAFTGESFVYAKVPAPTEYTLQYSMQVPLRPKTQNVSDDLFGFGNGVGVNSAIAYVNGINTATAGEISREASAAKLLDTDKDRLPDVVEKYYGSDVSKTDTDADGFSDYDEVQKGYDPVGPGKLEYYDIWYGAGGGVAYNPIATNPTTSMKSAMSGVLPAIVLCQDSRGDIQAEPGLLCDGKNIPKANSVICKPVSTNSNAQTSYYPSRWPALSTGFTYGACSAETKAGKFSYKISNGACSIQCSEAGCAYTGC